MLRRNLDAMVKQLHFREVNIDASIIIRQISELALTSGLEYNTTGGGNEPNQSNSDNLAPLRANTVT